MDPKFTIRRGARGSWVNASMRLLAALVVCGAIGCGSAADKPQPAASEPARYELKGKVVSVDRSAKRLTVDHEAIPGFMGAMTMAYPVKDEHALDAVSVGDEVTAKLVSSDGLYWLEDIRVPNRKS